MMHRAIPLVAAYILLLLTLGCGGGANPLSPSESAPIPEATGQVITDAAGRTQFAVPFTIHIDPSSLTATVEPIRMAQAQPPQALRYDLDIANFLTPDTLKMVGVELTEFNDVRVRFQHSHPFPAPDFDAPITGRNRADLGYTGRLFILSDRFSRDLSDGILVDPLSVRDPDGYASPGDLLHLPDLTNTHFPFILLADEVEDNRVGVSNGGAIFGNYDAVGGWQRANAGAGSNEWTGYDYIHQGQSIINEFTLDRGVLALSDWTLNAAIVIQYTDPRGVGGKEARMPPASLDVLQFAYRLPFATIDVSRFTSPCGHKLLMPHSDAIATMTATLRDWDAVSSPAGDADLSDETEVNYNQPGGPGTPSIVLVLPELSPAPLPIKIASGNGLPGEGEFDLSVDIDNLLDADPGTRWGYLRARDPEFSLDRSAYHSGVDWQTLVPDPARAVVPEVIYPVRVYIPPRTQSWALPWGDIGDEVSLFSEMDGDGNIYVVGTHFSPGSDVEPGECREPLQHRGGYDIFITKLDPNGQRIWSGSIGGPEQELPIGLAVDRIGQPVIAFTTDSDFVDLEPGIEVNPRTFERPATILMKLDNNTGETDWVRSWMPDLFALVQVSDIVIRPDTNLLYVVGGYINNVDLDPGVGEFFVNSNQDDDMDPFLLTIDNTAELFWCKTWTMPGFGYDYLASVASTPTGVVAAGTLHSDLGELGGLVDLNPDGGTDESFLSGFTSAMLVAFSTLGEYEWGNGWLTTTVADPDHDEQGQLLQVSSSVTGFPTVLGAFLGTTDFDPGAGEYPLTAGAGPFGSYFVQQFDSSGDFRWAFTYGDTLRTPYNQLIMWTNPMTSSVWLAGTLDQATDLDTGPGTAVVSPTGIWSFAASYNVGAGAFERVQTWETSEVFINEVDALTSGRHLVTMPFHGAPDVDPGVVSRVHASRGGADSLILNLGTNMDWN